MELSKINIRVLENLIKLSKKRDALLAELKTVEAGLKAAFAGGKPAARAVARPGVKTAAVAPKPVAKAAGKTGRRGALKTKILAALRAAGGEGIAVKDLSKKLGVKNQNVHVWFSSTGKKISAIQKLGAGAYRLKPGA